MRHLACWLLLILGLVVWTGSARAAAWVESTVVSDGVTVQLERDGRATVNHTIALKVRGGPLKTWTLQGVDSDAEPLPDAYVVSAALDKGNSVRKELILARGDDQSLQIDVADDKGLRQGTYLLEFGYRTDFRVTKMLRPHGAWLELAWVGARFSTGLDGAKVTFRIPAASTPPRVAELDLEPNQPESQGTPVDSFVSTVRRNAGFDEIELLRAHVAQGEPVLWRIWVNPAALEQSVLPGTQTHSERTAPLATHNPRTILDDWAWVLVAGIGALTWVIALLAKLRRHADDCKVQGVCPQALVKLSPVLRVTLSGGLVAASILFTWLGQNPNVATVCTVLAMLLAIQRCPQDARRLRGPGVWLPLTDTEAFAHEHPVLRGRFMDITEWQGRLTAAIVVAIVGAAVYVASRSSAYDAALLGLLAPLPLPLFVTALARELPHARQARKRAWLSKLHRRLSRVQQLKVVACARFPEGESLPDELRLRVIPPFTIDGLLGIEVGYNQITNDQFPTVCLLIRAKEGSAAQRVWQDRLIWQRGRRAEERVALHELNWPSIALTTDVVLELLNDFRIHGQSDVRNPNSRSRLVKSSVKGARQSKAGTTSLPSQTIRRA
jgi:hypothetical protein